MSKGLLEPTIKKFFTNYDEKKMDFSLFSGEIKLSNLFMNKDAINEVLDKANLPFQLCFGMITKMHIKIAIIGLYIELVDIEDLVVVIKPDASKGANATDDVMEAQAKKAILKHMVSNFQKLRAGSSMDPLESVSELPAETAKQVKENNEKATLPFGGKPVPEPETEESIRKKQEKPNLMGPELFGIITGRLEFDITIKNTRIYFEDSKTMKEQRKAQSLFSLCFVLSELRLTTQDLYSFCDAQGNFKDLFNVNNLLNTMAKTTKLIYLNFFVSRISLEIYQGDNHILPDTIDSDIKTKDPAFFVDYFQRLNSRRKGLFIELFTLDSLTFDIVLGHDQADTSAVPIQALIFYASLKEMTLNVQLEVLSNITHILNNVASLKALASISNMRPPIKPMSRNFVREFSNTERFSEEQAKLLRQINKELIREYFAIVMWRDFLTKYSAIDKLDPAVRMIYKYRSNSLIYQLIHGQTPEAIEKDKQEFIKKEQEYLKKVEEHKESVKKMKQLFSKKEEEKKPEGPEDLKAKMNRIFSMLSKQTWKFHVHFRLHANFFINLYSHQMKKDLSLIMKGLDVNLIKPRGKFHMNIGVLLKYLVVILNIPQMSSTKAQNRSIFENQSNVRDSQKPSIRAGGGSVRAGASATSE